MGPKKDPMAPILVHEDVFIRGRKFVEQKIGCPPAKGELTAEQLCVPPAFHSDPSLKSAIHFWSQQAIVRLTDDKKIEPSRLSRSSSDKHLGPRPRKEMAEVAKLYKAQVKQAEKRTVQFLKQLEKSEAKQAKRDAQIEKVADMEKSLNDELREAREYSKRQRLFDPKFMTGSKFGEKCPRKNVWIVAEASELTGPYTDNIIDEITKFINTCIDANCNSFNIGIFGRDSWVQWCPSYQSPKDAKKGTADSLKWLGKQLSAKICNANEWPPNWVQMFQKCLEEGLANPKMEPSTIYLACSKPPEDTEAVYTAVEGKGVPIQAISFDEEMEENEDCKKFFENLCGPKGGIAIDTSQRDLLLVDKMLNNCKTKKKQLDKLQAQLARMEDMTEIVTENSRLLAQQISLENFLRNEQEVAEEDLKNEDLQRDVDGNLVLPDSVIENMKELGKKQAC